MRATALRYLRFAAALSAAVLCSCTTVPTKPIETVTIIVQQPYPICIGVCVDYNVSISSDGQVDSHAHRLFPGEYRFRVRPQLAADIIARFDRIRPRMPEPVEPCRHDASKNGGWDPRDLDSGPWLVIRWSGTTETQLVRCDFDAETGPPVNQTMKELGLSLGIPRSVMERRTKSPAPSPCTVKPWLRNCLLGT